MRYLIVILFLVFSHNAFANVCADLFWHLPIEETIRELAELRLQLDLSQTSNETSLVLSALEIEFRQREKSLLQYLEKNKIMSFVELRKQIKYQISLIQNQAEKSQEIEARKLEMTALKDLQVSGRQGFFHFLNRENYKFQLMSTKVTQIIWKKVADLINERLGGAKPSFLSRKRVEVRITLTEHIGDLLPMHTVSFKDVDLWIKGLNELSKKGTPELKEIFPEHKHKDSYFLPGRFEYETVEVFANFADYSLSDIAWYEGNSDKKIHPVGEKEPVSIDRQPFYDLLGNVQEWTNEKTNVNSVAQRYYRGVDYTSAANKYSTHPRWFGEENSGYVNVGFRLAKKTRKR